MPQAPPVPGYDMPTGGTSGSTTSSGSTTVQGAANGTISVGGYTVSLNNGVNPGDTVRVAGTHPIGTGGQPLGEASGNAGIREGGDFITPGVPVANTDTVQNQIQSFASWSGDATRYNQFRLQAYEMGLVPTKSASKAELLVAWQTVVEEAAKENVSIPDILAKGTSGGWNSLNPQIAPGDNGLDGTGNINNSPDNSTTRTTYVSYLDPAQIQGSLADSYQRLLGRNPTSAEYQAFLNSVYSYENQENTGKFENKDVTNPTPGGGPNAGGGATLENIISQRGIGQRGLQFLAGQAAMNQPEEGAYQAATTYFNAFAKALAAPAAGMQASGPTAMAP